MSRQEYDVDEALSRLGKSGWTFVAYGSRIVPCPLVAFQRLGDHVDVLVMEGEDRCAAYRAPAWPGDDPVSVQSVRWCYMGAICVVLPRLLALPTVDQLWPLYPIPPEIRLPDPTTRPITIRPPQ